MIFDDYETSLTELSLPYKQVEFFRQWAKHLGERDIFLIKKGILDESNSAKLYDAECMDPLEHAFIALAFKHDKILVADKDDSQVKTARVFLGDERVFEYIEEMGIAVLDVKEADEWIRSNGALDEAYAVDEKEIGIKEESAGLNLVDLRRKLDEYFGETGLRDLSFDLGIEYESLSGESKRDKVRGLIGYCRRRGLLPCLYEKCRELRPNVSWQ